MKYDEYARNGLGVQNVPINTSTKMTEINCFLCVKHDEYAHSGLGAQGVPLITSTK